MKRLTFSLEMFKAAIEGRKTVTRRVKTKEKPPYEPGEVVGLACPHWRRSGVGPYIQKASDPRPIPSSVYDEVTESYRYEIPDFWHETEPLCTAAPSTLALYGWHKMPAFLMPAWACTHFAEIVSCQPERLQEITPADVRLEGLAVAADLGAEFGEERVDLMLCEAFQRLWDSLNAARGCGWDTKPKVSRIEFRLSVPAASPPTACSL